MGCNFTSPFDHSPPVNHGGAQILLHEWPDECIWAQLQYEQWLQGRDHLNYTNTLYLTNLKEEWERRAICSRCHRSLDIDLDQQVSDLEVRVQNAEDKLGRLRRLIMVTPDAALRPELMNILDEQ
jgi:hypothetical protein